MRLRPHVMEQRALDIRLQMWHTPSRFYLCVLAPDWGDSG
jgi:hypothetical protein